MAKRNNKNRKKKTDPVARFLRPTEQREAHNDFQSAGAAVRVVPPIAQLRKSEILTQEEFEALAYYRDQANLAHRSPTRSCIDFSPKGGGHGPGAAILSAVSEVKRMEGGLGCYLSQLLEYVVRDDNPLRAWCVQHHGDHEGQKVGETILELKYAAGGIVR